MEMDAGVAADDLEEREGAADVGLIKSARAGNAAIDVAFSCEMDDRIDVVFDAKFFHESFVADISLDKQVAGIVLDGGKVTEIGSIGEKIEIDDLFALFQCVADECGTDKASAAGDKESFKRWMHRPANNRLTLRPKGAV